MCRLDCATMLLVRSQMEVCFGRLDQAREPRRDQAHVRGNSHLTFILIIGRPELEHRHDQSGSNNRFVCQLHGVVGGLAIATAAGLARIPKAESICVGPAR